MTRRGFGFLVVTAAIYLAANQTRVGWLYVVTAWMVAVMLASLLLPRLWVQGLRVTRTVALPRTGDRPAPREDDVIDVTLTVRPGRFRSYLIELTEQCPFDAPEAWRRSFFLLDVAASGATVHYQAACYKRGRYLFPPLEVESRGPFGLFCSRKSIALPDALTVYPWYLEPSARPAGATRLSEVPSGRAGSGVDVLGTREYRHGDPVRAIHWRSTARRALPIVKEFEAQQSRGIALVLETATAYGSGRDTTLEYGVKLAASLARWALDTGRPFRLLAAGAPPGPAAWRHTLEYLASVQSSAEAPSAAGLIARSAPGESLVIAAPELSAPIPPAAAAALRGRRCLAIAFTGFDHDGLDAPAFPAGLETVPWPKGAPPAEAIARVLQVLETW